MSIAHLVAYSAALVFLIASPAYSFWILSHSPLGLDARLDPVVFPGFVSPHAHTFVGQNAVTSSQNNVSMQAASCTTAQVQADKSSYWAPTLFKYSNGAFAARTLGVVQSYYLQRGKMPLQAFPPGLKMVAGNAMASGPQSTKQLQNVVSFVCLNYATGSPQTSTLPAGPCPQGLRAQIIFPSCWNGKDLDSFDHVSHMAYPLGDSPDNGDACPSTHPIRFITLFYEFIWNVGSQPNNGSWMFANGDSIGYSFHADFQNGWDTNVLQAAINQCTGQLFGDLESCPPFVPSLDRSKAASCRVDPSKVTGLSSEQVNGKIGKLPGCNPVQNGPNAGAGSCGTNPNIAQPTADGYKGCYAEPTSGVRALPRRANPTSNTVSACRAACSQMGMSIAGLEFSSECWCGNTFTSGTVSMLDSDCAMTCSGDSSQICGDASRLSVYSSLSSMSTSSTPSTPAVISTNFKSLGCFKDSSSSRTLPVKVDADDTLEACAAACSNYKFFGAEYANECFCGNTLTAPQIADSSCNMVCASNSAQLCGGPNALTVYNNTAVTTPVGPTAPATISTNFKSLGCYQDNPSSRSLTTRVNADNLEACAAACSNYRFFGTEYANECFCGNTLSAPQIADSSCNMACASNSKQLCGGPNALTTYNNTAYAAAAAVTPTLLSGTRALGCYADSGTRSLSYAAYSNNQNSPSTCASACRAQGYKYSGTQYSSECYCGNFLLNAAAQGVVSDGCNMPCSGSTSQTCGGSFRLNIVIDDQYTPKMTTATTVGNWAFSDCIIDSPSSRALGTSFNMQGANTPTKCLAACKAAQMPYCGMEYSGECYGSKTAPTSGSAPASGGNNDPIARGCSMACSGDSTLACGGSNRLNLYTFPGNIAA